MNKQDVQKAISEIKQEDLDKLKKLVDESDQIILIGNGGSNSIASHIAVDYNKFLNKRSLAFTDASMLTAFVNDYGSTAAYKQFIRFMKTDKTLVILISSSGKSKNIFWTGHYCQENNLKFVTLTGFSETNLVRTTFKDVADLDYWVDSCSYGTVECVHQIFLHMIVDN